MDAFTPLFADGAGRRLLDVGCGAGCSSRLAHERGFDCYGVDLSADAIDHARKQPWGANTHHRHAAGRPGDRRRRLRRDHALVGARAPRPARRGSEHAAPPARARRRAARVDRERQLAPAQGAARGVERLHAQPPEVLLAEHAGAAAPQGGVRRGHHAADAAGQRRGGRRPGSRPAELRRLHRDHRAWEHRRTCCARSPTPTPAPPAQLADHAPHRARSAPARLRNSGRAGVEQIVRRVSLAIVVAAAALAAMPAAAQPPRAAPAWSGSPARAATSGRQGRPRQRRRHDRRRRARATAPRARAGSASAASRRWSRRPTARATAPATATRSRRRSGSSSWSGAAAGRVRLAAEDPGEHVARPLHAHDRREAARPLARRRHDDARRGARAVVGHVGRVGAEPLLQRAASRRRSPRSAACSTPTACGVGPERRLAAEAVGQLGRRRRRHRQPVGRVGQDPQPRPGQPGGRSAAGTCATPGCAATRSPPAP